MPVDPRAVSLYDEYTHRPLERRVFLERLAALAGSAAAALALLPLLENDYAQAAQVAPDDPAIDAGRAEAPGGAGKVQGTLARPREGKKHPAVIVIHENRGLNAHIEDVARRAAKAGFLALAPDLLSASGGTPKDEDQAREKIGALDRQAVVADLVSLRRWLASHKHSTGKVGAVGFCWGGGMVNQRAVADPGLQAGVVFYGMSPDPAQVPAIKAKLLLHYAGLDERIDAGVPAYEAALKQAGVSYTLHMYDGVQHAFHNDTNAARYDAAAAALAWKRTIDFLTATLA
ncbi:MAG TPA: dienelactone hydrolase family protein [Candidatus Polarisedimenticolia bacterium]|nr:dienelactone hydrolase family protein [Candidatus Polarisedimenticolia bacterium]